VLGSIDPLDILTLPHTGAKYEEQRIGAGSRDMDYQSEPEGTAEFAAVSPTGLQTPAIPGFRMSKH
jgi:hypothetical protein